MKTAQVICGILACSFLGDSKAAELISAQALLDRVAAERNQSTAKTNVADARVTELRQGLTNLINQRA